MQSCISKYSTCLTNTFPSLLQFADEVLPEQKAPSENVI